MDPKKLHVIAKAMVAPGKGILAIDESTSTCTKRFKDVGIESTEENRRQYRQLLVTAPGIEEAISGMILYDETFWQKTDDGVPFTKVLKDKGILSGIKVDTGAKDLALHPGEQITEGLDGLRERLKKYADNGAAFAKWRAVITIGKGIPSRACINANTHALARYAALCQEAGLVPMVEPEVLIDGDHSIDLCYEVTSDVLSSLFEQLQEQGVYLAGTILKTSMVISGTKAKKQSTVEEVAKATVKCLHEHVPPILAGVVFLSGGMTDIQSTENLNAMNTLGEHPWPLSFSYGRAIQHPALTNWAKGNIEKAKTELVHRAKMNGLAAIGKYTEKAEKI